MPIDRTVVPERNLDVLRALAVSCVLFDHVAIALHTTHRLLVTQIGNAGVLLFFVHTALVLMASMERHGQGAGWVRAFYVRRGFRIYPLAIVVVLLVLALRIPGGTPTRGDVHVFHPLSSLDVVANLLLVQNVIGLRNVLAPFWSLPLEVQMYVMLPMCFVATRRPRHMALVFGGLLAAYVVVAFSGIPGVWRLSVFEYGPSFFGGVLAYFLLRRTPATIPSPVLPFVLVGAIASVPLLGTTMRTFPRAWVPCLALGLILPRIRELPESVVTQAAKVVATYSYGIYLLHVPVLWLAFSVDASLPLVLQIAVVGSGLVVFPWLAYHAIEQPGIRLGQRLALRRRSPALITPRVAMTGE